MAYTDYEGEICAVKYLPKGSVENEGNLYCSGVGGKKDLWHIFCILKFLSLCLKFGSTKFPL